MTQPNRQQQVIAYLLATTGVILFSLKAIFVKKAYEYDIDTVSLLLLRMLFSFPVYFAIATITTIRAVRRGIPTPRQIFFMVMLGVIGYYLSSYLDFSGLQYISASLERLILYAYPTLVVILTAIFFRKPIPQKQWIAIMITYFGVFLTFSQGALVSGQTNLFKGGLLILACAFTYAGYLVGSDRLIPVFGSFRFTAYAMIIACVAIVIHFSLSSQKPITGYPKEVYWIGIGMAVLSTILPSFMISEAIRRIGAPAVAIIGSIGPFATIIFETIFLGERITAFEGLGTIVVISGVLLITGSSNKELVEKEEETKIVA